MLESPNVQAEPLPGRPYPRLSENVPEAAFGGPVGQGLEQLGEAEFGEQHKLKMQGDQLRTVDAVTQLRNGITRLQYGDDGQGGVYSLHGVDAINLPSKILPQYQALASQISATLTPDQQRLFQPHVLESGAELNTNLERHEFEEHQRLADTVYKNGRNSVVEGATVSWRDPAVLERSRHDLAGLVQMEGDRKGWTPEIRTEELREATSDLHYNVIEGMIASERPAMARAYLYQNLADMSTKQGETAQRMIQASEEHAIVVQSKKDEIAAQSVLKTGLQMAANGQLTPEWAFQHAGPLKAHELQFLLQTASGKKTESDSQTYSDLLISANRGQDVIEPARAALVAGKLNQTDFTRIVDMSGKDRPNYVKAGTDYITKDLAVSLLNPDPARADAQANALRDWDRWNIDNPQAKPSDALKESEAIANRYRLIDSTKSILTLPVPKYFAGSRAQPDIDETERRTVEAFNNKDISTERAASEALLIKQWRKAIEDQKARQAAAAAKKQP